MPLLPTSLDYKNYSTDFKKVLEIKNNDRFQEYKLRYIFRTLPATREECANWFEYEFSEKSFWNIDLFDEMIDTSTIQPDVIKLLENQKYCFITAHTTEEYTRFKKIFKNCKTIELINDEIPNQLSRIFKGNIIRETAKLPPVLNDSIKFNIGSLFNQTEFFNNVDNLLNNLEISDKSLDKQVYNFYNQYINLYQL